MDVRCRLAVLAAVLVFAPACSDNRREASDVRNAAATSLPRPKQALIELIESAGVRDHDAMWRTLSRSTRRRLGPTVGAFGARSGPSLARRLGPLARARYRVILEEQITLRLAVAAIAGEYVVSGRREFAAYAAALTLESGTWRIVLDPSVRIVAARPNPGERVVQRTQLAADVATPGPIEEAGMWIDGRAFPAKCGSTDAKHLEMWGEAPQPLRNGRHTVVAFASAGQNASALAWTFIVQGGKRGQNTPPKGR
jgi:hypothetical protein